MNMNEAKDLINNGDGIITKAQMLEIIQTFRDGLRGVANDLKEIDDLGEDDYHQLFNIPSLECADWALDVFTKKLMFELAEENEHKSQL